MTINTWLVDYYATLALRVLPTITYCYKFVDMQARWSTVQYYCLQKNLNLILKTVFWKFSLLKFPAIWYVVWCLQWVHSSCWFQEIHGGSIRATKFIILDCEKQSVHKVKMVHYFFCSMHIWHKRILLSPGYLMVWLFITWYSYRCWLPGIHGCSVRVTRLIILDYFK